MIKAELLEQLGNIKNDLSELIAGVEKEASEDGRPSHSVFYMPFLDVHRILNSPNGLKDIFKVGDQIVNQHSKYGPIAWDIIGLNVDQVEGGYYTLTLQMHDVLPGAFPYDEESEKYEYGHAHYPTCSLRKWLNEDFLKGFSLEDDIYWMKPVPKVTYTANSEGAKPETTEDKLFLLSASEVGFTGNTIRDEGAAYEYYAGNPERRQKTEMGNAATARLWWLRSPNLSNASNARSVNTSGAQDNYGAYSGYGAAAACVIC